MWLLIFLALLLYQENHEEAQEELPKKVKFFFSAAVQNWDAEFYIKVDDNIDLDLGKDFLFYFLSVKLCLVLPCISNLC